MVGSWQVWAGLSALFAALTAIFGKVGVSGVNSDYATLLRTLVIVVVLAAFVAATGQLQPIGQINRKSLLFLTFSALATGASWVCYYRALQLGPAARVAPVDKLSVVLVALFGAVFLGERPSPQGWIGIALIAAGAVLIAIKG